MKGLFAGLQYLHQQNVIHRDLKPANILIGSYKDLSRVKIIDFGLAVREKPGSPVEDYRNCGTVLYRPPEQFVGSFMYAKKADIWATGLIMFELLVGKHPYWEAYDTKATIT